MGAMKEIFGMVDEMRKDAEGKKGIFYKEREIAPTLAVAYARNEDGEWMWIFNPVTGHGTEHYRIDREEGV